MYNSVWEAFRTANKDINDHRNSRKEVDLESDYAMIEADDLETLNKNLSDKKLPSYGMLEEERAMMFK